ncbi:MAG: hypothetical protein KBC46_03465 [Ferrovibrio sp.]|nr:hypothetical protein [Ferrovibrio sp.]
MTPKSISAFIRRRGRDVVLRRLSGGAQPSHLDVVVKAVIRGYKPSEITGTLQQGDRLLFAGNTEIAEARWPGPPKRGDVVLDGGKAFTIVAPDIRFIGGEAGLHVLTIRGG